MSAWLQTKEWYYSKLVIQFTASIVIAIIFIIEMYIACHKIIETRRKNSFSLKIALLITTPLSIYLSYFSMSFSGLYGDMHWDNQYCYSALASTISYFFAKNFLYQLFVLRLYTIYGSSSFQYNIKLLLSISIFSFLACLSWIIWCSLKLEIHNEYQDNLGCIIYLPPFFNEGGAFIDFIISTLCLYLFLKPLTSLIATNEEMMENERENKSKSSLPDIEHNHSENNPKHTGSVKNVLTLSRSKSYESQHSHSPSPPSRKGTDGDDMYFLAEKYTLLTMIGVISTFMIVCIVGIFGGGSLIIIDGMINCIVVALMNEKYNTIYVRSCGSCRICMHFCIICCCQCRKRGRQDEVDLARNIELERKPSSLSPQKSV